MYRSLHFSVLGPQCQVIFWHKSLPCCPATLPHFLVQTRTANQRKLYYSTPPGAPRFPNTNRAPEHTLRWPYNHRLGTGNHGHHYRALYHPSSSHTGILGLHIVLMLLGLLASPKNPKTLPSAMAYQASEPPEEIMEEKEDIEEEMTPRTNNILFLSR